MQNRAQEEEIGVTGRVEQRQWRRRDKTTEGKTGQKKEKKR